MSVLIVVLGLGLIGFVLHDGFEVMLLPRRVTRSFRLTRFFYVYGWRAWREVARRFSSGKRLGLLLSWFGPLSVILLLVLWATCLISCFATIHWALGTRMVLDGGRSLTAAECFYFSGVTFFTLGFGDIAPLGPVGRFLAVAEAGIGFAFLAAVIGYLPVFYSAFSTREVTISMLDARAGSPPTAATLLLRLAPSRDHRAILDRYFQEWEHWSAQLLESYLSFPLLSFYRSQHDNQSWLAAMTAILDASSLVIAGAKGVDPYQAQLAFAMSRHAIVDLCQVFRAPPSMDPTDRLPADRLAALLEDLDMAGLDVREGPGVAAKLAELRGLYEPFLRTLSAHLVLDLPPFAPAAGVVDNWQTSAWMKRAGSIGELARADPGDDHADP